jgi:hypothetical protein
MLSSLSEVAEDNFARNYKHIVRAEGVTVSYGKVRALSDVDQQPLSRNIFVGRQITNRFGFISVAEEHRIANDLLLRKRGFRGVCIDADSAVTKLSGGERQGVAIGRAMHFSSELYFQGFPPVTQCVLSVAYHFSSLNINTGAEVETHATIAGPIPRVQRGIR